MLLTEEFLNKIKNNTVGAHLDLSNQNLEDEDVEALIDALKKNHTVRSINLSKNEFISDRAGKLLVECLSGDSIIQAIDLSETGIGRQTAEKLKTVLEGNHALTVFHGLPTISEVAHALKEGKSRTDYIDVLNKIETQLTVNLITSTLQSFQEIGGLVAESISNGLSALEERYPAIKKGLNTDDDGHYIPEAYRLLTGMFCMSLGSNQENAEIKALGYLSYPYRTSLKSIANLALAQYLFTSETLNAADASVQEARYQWLLHALRDMVSENNPHWQVMMSYALMRVNNRGESGAGREFGHSTAAVNQGEVVKALDSFDLERAMKKVTDYMEKAVAVLATPSSACPRLFSGSATPSVSSSKQQLTNKR